jgi:hypothetical protein
LGAFFAGGSCFLRIGGVLNIFFSSVLREEKKLLSLLSLLSHSVPVGGIFFFLLLGEFKQVSEEAPPRCHPLTYHPMAWWR